MPSPAAAIYQSPEDGLYYAYNDQTGGYVPATSTTDTFAKIATSLGLGVQQYQLMNLNVERARQGLPPIDVARYSGAGVNIGLSPGTQQLVTYAGLALVGLLLLNMATRK
jgi:hypothetical protein